MSQNDLTSNEQCLVAFGDISPSKPHLLAQEATSVADVRPVMPNATTFTSKKAESYSNLRIRRPPMPKRRSIALAEIEKVHGRLNVH